MSEPRIVAAGLGKHYVRRQRRHRTWRAWLARPWQRSAVERFWALQDVSFAVHPGEMLGVIGHNGAGKSTLLTLLSGLSEPTTGQVSVTGRIGGLLALGGGFADDLTGRENAILAGVVAGLTRAEVRARLDEIVAFAEIGGFLDEPVRTYSTGMRMRLAFAVAVHTDPDVLLIDEFLAVGDLGFQSRCRARIVELRDQGCAIVAVSHGMDDMRESCDRVLWLRAGQVVALDSPAVVTELYEDEMRRKTLERTPKGRTKKLPGGRKLRGGQQRLGSMELEITGVALHPGGSIDSGGSLEVEIEYAIRQAVSAPVFGVSITREDGTVCLDTNTQSAHVGTADLPSKGCIRFAVERLDLGAGDYFVNVGVFESNWSHAYDYHWHVYPLRVDGAPEHKGILASECRWEAGTRFSAPALDRGADAYANGYAQPQ